MSMTDNDLHKYLAAMFEAWGYPLEEPAGSTILGREGIGLDSMALMELQTRLYSDQGIILEDEELPAIGSMTVDDLVALITDRQASAQEGSP
jgi:acyl carrier protein